MMNAYLEKHRFCERQLSAPVLKDVFIIVVIPCYNEPELLKTLQSLRECAKTNLGVEVLVVINSCENGSVDVLKQNQKTFDDAVEWIKKNGLTPNPSPKGEGGNEGRTHFHIINLKNLPQKHAGVGLARKIGMDEAVARFDEIKNNDGIIVCLDADCTVEKNYLTEIEKHFLDHPKATGCSVYFEHPIEGNEFSQEVYEGIINYELFLRYYVRALQYCNFPYAFHTIGSCMAVRNNVYQKQGGMNRRKAGEDFYFLHKIFPLGNHVVRQTGFSELNTTCVIPSPRESNRVPFGTGSAIQKIISPLNPPPEAGDFSSLLTMEYLTYNIQSFIDLKMLFDVVPELFLGTQIDRTLPTSIKSFLQKNNFENKLSELKQHTSNEKTFVKRFFNWFDGFIVLKFVHYARDHFYEQMKICEAAIKLAELSGKSFKKDISKKELLIEYRKWERN